MIVRNKTRTNVLRGQCPGAVLVLALTLLWLPGSHSRAADSHVIQDGNGGLGGLIYWGGKYVNVKPSQYSDVIGSRSRVDQMEVIMKDDIVTVKITGPYFHNYMNNLNGTRTIPPGDLYIASQGWKVKGVPPYIDDVFEAAEGWAYVVSFTGKALYKLNFADIAWTRPQPGVKKFRANQAWRGGYGQRVDDAVVELTDTALSFTFSVRNMRLGPEIGLHWTMMCGNDIIEGSAPLPAIPLAPVSADPADAQVVGADALADEVLPMSFSSAASYLGPALPPPSADLGVGVGGAFPPGAIAAPLFLVAPRFFKGGKGDNDNGPTNGAPDVSPDGSPDRPQVDPQVVPFSLPVPVSEPPTSATMLLGMLLLGVAAMRARRRIA
jgi:MYXO-CTERM domain-containing protein